MEYFKVHNSVRDIDTRLQRRMAPQQPAMKQFLGGGELRVLRGRPITLTREQLEAYLEELKVKVAAGALWVSTLDDQEVDLETLAPTVEASAEPPAPNPPLDSVNNDKNQGIGENIPQFAGGFPVGAVPPTGETGGIPGPLEAERAEMASETQADPAATEVDVPFEDPATTTSGKKKKGSR